jgi:hypothetical protein
MVRVARRDTYGLEDIGGVKVRRRIFAGRPIPSHYEVESGAFEEMDAPPMETPEPVASEPDPEPQAKPTGGGRRPRTKPR